MFLIHQSGDNDVFKKVNAGHSVPSLKPLGPGVFQDLKFFRFQQGEMVLCHSLYVVPGQVWGGTF